MYIKPTRTLDKLRAATGFELIVTDDDYPYMYSHKNVAEGAAGEFRYILPVYSDGPKVTRIFFLEADNPHWGGCTENINKNRYGRSLALCWETPETGINELLISYYNVT